MDVSVVICTHNRSPLLREALSHLLVQQTSSFAVEVIVVDNNSDDDTAEVVAELADSTSKAVRYIFEARQGISFARNTGWRAARGAAVAFTDDDVRTSPDWIGRIVAAFAAQPDVDAVGGKVLPVWPVPPPAWLTRDHWAPIAILDYGDSVLRLDREDPRCLIGANVAFRRAVLERLDGFSPLVQRVKDGIGSIEDHEFLIRLWDAGGVALYLPELVAVAPVDPPRLSKRYHRRWYTGHGHFHALMRSTSLERSTAGHLFGVPGHLYRQCLIDLMSWLACAVRGQWDRAFLHETRIRFFLGFFRTRRREYVARRAGTVRDTAAIGRAVLASAYARLRGRSTGAS